MDAASPNGAAREALRLKILRGLARRGHLLSSTEGSAAALAVEVPIVQWSTGRWSPCIDIHGPLAAQPPLVAHWHCSIRHRYGSAHAHAPQFVARVPLPVRPNTGGGCARAHWSPVAVQQSSPWAPLSSTEGSTAAPVVVVPMVQRRQKYRWCYRHGQRPPRQRSWQRHRYRRYHRRGKRRTWQRHRYRLPPNLRSRDLVFGLGLKSSIWRWEILYMEVSYGTMYMFKTLCTGTVRTGT